MAVDSAAVPYTFSKYVASRACAEANHDDCCHVVRHAFAPLQLKGVRRKRAEVGGSSHVALPGCCGVHPSRYGI